MILLHYKLLCNINNKHKPRALPNDELEKKKTILTKTL